MESTNRFFADISPFICSQVEMHYSLMATTVPCLKPFIIRFNTAWGTADTQGVSSYALNSIQKTSRARSVTRGERDVHAGQLRLDFVSHTKTLVMHVSSNKA